MMKMKELGSSRSKISYKIGEISAFPPLIVVRLQVLKESLTVPEALSLHQAYYIRKKEHKVKWVLQHIINQQTTLLTSLTSLSPSNPDSQQIPQIQHNISLLREELLRIHPANSTPDDGEVEEKKDEISPLSTPLSTESTASPLLRVCDILKTEIVGVEVFHFSLSFDSMQRRSNHHNYVINVTCRKNPSWQVGSKVLFIFTCVDKTKILPVFEVSQNILPPISTKKEIIFVSTKKVF
jgi:hypothetical protein